MKRNFVLLITLLVAATGLFAWGWKPKMPKMPTVQMPSLTTTAGYALDLQLLYEAVEDNRAVAVKRLLDKNPNLAMMPASTAMRTESALDIAKRNKNKEIVWLLKQAMAKSTGQAVSKTTGKISSSDAAKTAELFIG